MLLGDDLCSCLLAPSEHTLLFMWRFQSNKSTFLSRQLVHLFCLSNFSITCSIALCACARARSTVCCCCCCCCYLLAARARSLARSACLCLLMLSLIFTEKFDFWLLLFGFIFAAVHHAFAHRPRRRWTSPSHLVVTHLIGM